MKISSGGKSTESTSGKRSKKTSSSSEGKTESASKTFAATVSEVESDVHEQEIDELFAEIQEKAEVLVKKQTDTALQEYKDLVSKFLKKVIGENVKITEITSTFFMENSKVYVLAKNIDQGLADLAEQVHSGNPDAMKIAAKSSEIRGWLIDIRS
ncbi:MAG: YaaR family protein [Candidatus Lindowbacteria bacterium]|nr:YaaR family protein [Candidatus Lindowbacteria bacterium]